MTVLCAAFSAVTVIMNGVPAVTLAGAATTNVKSGAGLIVSVLVVAAPRLPFVGVPSVNVNVLGVMAD